MLVTSVHEALVELHSKGWAHSDARLDNMQENGQWKAMLINMERSELKSVRTAEVMGCYGDSVMYYWPDDQNDRTVNFLDFRQLGIMIIYILPPTHNYHTDHPNVDTRLDNELLQSLLEEGTFHTCFCDRWAAFPFKK